ARVPGVDHAALRLTRVLDEQRDEGEVREVALRRPTPQVAATEADPVVGHDDYESLVPEPDLVQPGDELAEELVGVADLEQMALPGLGRQLAVEPALAVAARRIRARDRAGLAVGEVEPGRVREQEVRVVERRPPRGGPPE